MKYWRAYLHFYKSQLMPGIALFLLCWAFLGLEWALGIYWLFGGLLGFYSFRSFYPNRIIFYHNLGITNWKLIEISSVINIGLTLLLSLVIAGVYSLFA